MPQSNSVLPDEDERSFGYSLHQRLLANDPLAPSDVAEAYLGRVNQALKFNYPTTEDDLISDASTEAWQNYILKPTSFDPARRSLFGYLKMSAEGDLKNSLAKIKRVNSRLVSLDNIVALPASSRNNPIEEEFIEKQAVVEKILAWRDRQAGEAAPTVDTALDRQLLELMLSRERRTEVYAQLLRIEHLDPAQQRQIVKRHKDRLRLRLKRYRTTGK